MSGCLALAVASDNLATGGAAVLAALFYVAHLWIYSGHDGWLLEHTWTLSLEEHYYLVWPTLVAAALAGRRWRWFAMLAALSLLLLIATPWVVPEGIRAAYERGTPMIYGSLAALIWWRFRAVRAPSSVALIGDLALGITLIVVLFPRNIPEVLLMGATSVPGVLAVLVVVSSVALPSSLGSRCLGWAPLRWTGKRAYGLSLYHLPIISIMAHQVDFGFPGWLGAAIAVGLSFAMAAASYRWVELPFLRQKARFSPAS